MWVSQLRLVNFRNFRALRLEAEPGVLLFSGPNGQGKTNLLESVYVLATTRSPRTSVERELLSWRAAEDADLAAVMPPFARLDARVRRASGEVHLELTFEGERSGPNGTQPTAVTGVTRDIKVNGLATRAAGLVGQLPVVYFSPADVELAGGSPSGRRQYLNLANSQASPAHLRALQRYNRVLMQRNQVLRSVRERRQAPSALEPWTEQLVSCGSQILQQRLHMLKEVNARIASIFRDLAGGSESLAVAYRSTVCDAGASEAIEDSFRQRQAALASKEIDQAVSLVGPHRDDFTFVLDRVDLNTYGSRGQQRLAVLALKLAEADWMRAAIGEIPLVLLDDVLSELDPQRRAYVLHRVAEPEPTEQRQVWITTTEPDLSPADQFLTNAQRFVIDAGTVRTA